MQNAVRSFLHAYLQAVWTASCNGLGMREEMRTVTAFWVPAAAGMPLNKVMASIAESGTAFVALEDVPSGDGETRWLFAAQDAAALANALRRLGIEAGPPRTAFVAGNGVAAVAEPDEVDTASDESFPASDAPSY